MRLSVWMRKDGRRLLRELLGVGAERRVDRLEQRRAFWIPAMMADEHFGGRDVVNGPSAGIPDRGAGSPREPSCRACNRAHQLLRLRILRRLTASAAAVSRGEKNL